MINRDRAWRRKKTRHIVAKLQDAHIWLSDQIKEMNPKKPIAEAKQHQHGKLTQAQSMRQQWSLNQELADGL